VIYRKLSRNVAVLAGLALVASTAVVSAQAASAASRTSAADVYLAQIQKVDVAGLVIKFRDGVNPFARNGQVTASNFAGIKLVPRKGLGLGMYSVSFAGPVTKPQIAAAMANLARSPKVEFVSPDQIIKMQPTAHVAAAAAASNVSVKTVSASWAKSASAVRSLVATDAWSSSNPKLASVLLTWSKPQTLRGGSFLGYEIEQSANGGKSFTKIVTNTKSIARRFVVSSSIRAGVRYIYRVRALTKVGAFTKRGLASARSAVTPTTAPQTPVFVGSDVVKDSVSPTWLPQNVSQRGGLPVSYTVTASASGETDVTCQPLNSTTYSCPLTGLTVGKTYRASVTATNSRGSVTSLPTQTVTDPMFNHQWYLNGTYGINIENAWSFNKGIYISANQPKRVTVAVIDTGFTAHPDLDNQYVRESGKVYGFDFVTNHVKTSKPTLTTIPTNDKEGWDADPADPGDYDAFKHSSWHGTHVSGLIAAEANNGQGITGVAPDAQILPIRALGPQGGLSSDLAAAITWAVGLPVPQFMIDTALVPKANQPLLNLHPAQVINISMGTSGENFCDKTTQAAVTEAVNHNVTIVTSAGNDLMQAYRSYPGNCFGTINVGSTSAVGDRSSYSNSGPAVDVSAPGGDSTQTTNTDVDAAGQILSTINTGTRGPLAADYAYEEGTSMAAPLVSGVVALMYAAHPNITFAQAAQIIIETATPFNSDPNLAWHAGPTTNEYLTTLGHCANPNVGVAPVYSNDGRCGSGIVNAGAAVAAATALP
jgi:serine protease